MEKKKVDEDYLKLPGSIVRDNFDNGNLKFCDYFSTPPMFFTSDLRNAPLEYLYKGASVFLIAGGPSFRNINVDLLRKPYILTYGINNSPKSFRPNIWTCVDTPCNFLASIWLDPLIKKIVPISHINKKLFDSEKWKDTNIAVGECPNVYYYRRNEVVNTDEYLFEDTINWGNHSNVGGGRSVFLATMRIIYLLGFKNVYLLGVDFNMDENNNYHFPQDRNKGSINGNNHTYSSMKKWFKELRKYFDTVGFTVKNCNLDSKLDAFDFISFEEAINNVVKNFPDIEKEKTDGMYTRRADDEKKVKERRVKEIANKYTDEQKKEAKEKLDHLRECLYDSKEKVYRHLLTLFPGEDQQLFQWAHKLKRPDKNIKLSDLYNNLKIWVKNKKLGNNEYAELYNLQLKVEDARREFRNYEVEKNKIWGIVK